MKAKLKTRIAAAMAIPAMAMLSGCMNNTEFRAGVEFRQKTTATLNKENYSEALKKVYDPNDSLHNKVRINGKTMDKLLTSPLYQKYENQ